MAALPVVEPVDATDFSFRALRKLAVYREQNRSTTYEEPCLNLITCSAAHGLIFVADKDARTLTVVKSDQLHRLVPNKTNLSESVNAFDRRDFQVNGKPVFLKCNNDGTKLAVVVERDQSLIAVLFGAFDKPTPIQRELPLSSTPFVHLIAFSWNPLDGATFAAAASCGSIGVYTMTDQGQFTIVGSTTVPGVSCFCWSPKGKQLVLGKSDGTLAQYKPSLQLVKTIAAPSPGLLLDSGGVVSSVGVFWLTPTEFAVVFSFANAPNRVVFSLLVTSKTAAPVWYNFEDICNGDPSSNTAVKGRYLMENVAEWRVLLCASTRSVDVVPFGNERNNPSAAHSVGDWKPWLVDDIGRAELPLSNGAETFPVGMAIDYTSQESIRIDDHHTSAPKPVLVVLANDGTLVPYHLMNTASDAGDICRPPKNNLSLSNLRVGTLSSVVVQKTLPAVTTAASSKPNTTLLPAFSFAASSAQSQSTPAADVQSLLKRPQQTQKSATAQPITAPLVGGIAATSQHKTMPAATAQQTNVVTAATAIPKSTSSFQDLNTLTTETTAASKQEGTDGALRKLRTFLANEVTKFNQDFNSMSGRVFAPYRQVGTVEDLVALSESCHLVGERFHEDLGDRRTDAQTKLEQLQTDLTEAFLQVETVQSLIDSWNTPLYLHLMRQRPLDPAQKRRVAELRSSIAEMELMLNCRLEPQLIELSRRIEQQPKDRWKWFRKTPAGSDHDAFQEQVQLQEQRASFNQALVRMQASIGYQQKRIDRLSEALGALTHSEIDPSKSVKGSSFDGTKGAGRGYSKEPQLHFQHSKVQHVDHNRLRQILETQTTVPRRTTVPKLSTSTFRFDDTVPAQVEPIASVQTTPNKAEKPLDAAATSSTETPSKAADGGSKPFAASPRLAELLAKPPITATVTAIAPRTSVATALAANIAPTTANKQFGATANVASVASKGSAGSFAFAPAARASEKSTASVAAHVPKFNFGSATADMWNKPKPPIQTAQATSVATEPTSLFGVAVQPAKSTNAAASVAANTVVGSLFATPNAASTATKTKPLPPTAANVAFSFQFQPGSTSTPGISTIAGAAAVKPDSVKPVVPVPSVDKPTSGDPAVPAESTLKTVEHPQVPQTQLSTSVPSVSPATTQNNQPETTTSAIATPQQPLTTTDLKPTTAAVVGALPVTPEKVDTTQGDIPTVTATPPTATTASTATVTVPLVTPTLTTPPAPVLVPTTDTTLDENGMEDTDIDEQPAVIATSVGSPVNFSFAGQASGAFGAPTGQPAVGIFGVATTTAQSGGVFGGTTVSTAGAFGSGGFFGGLGGKPNPENVNRNVFGSPSTSTTTLTANQQALFSPSAQPQQQSSVFGGSAAPSSFNFNQSPQGGAFSGAIGGGVSAFGAKPAFGGGSTSSSSFGAKPKFGASSPMSVFGQQPAQQTASVFGSSAVVPASPPAAGGFAQFATQSSGSPSFGQLASAGSPPVVQSQSVFGGTSSVFGGVNQPGANTGVFGGQSTLGGSAQFSQWR